jgi:ABC-2 type transport system ATP-binding protein
MTDIPAIETKGLSKTYSSLFGRQPIHALKDLDLSVPGGEIFGLLGPNGAGKTTLVKTLLGLIKPTRGMATLFGIPISRPSARRRIGYLPEDHRFPSYLTAETTLDFYGSLSGMPRASRREKMDKALNEVGLLDWKKVKTRKFSKGMKQRLGIAQAIFHEPDLIFLDEPTDGVDPLGRKAIRELILDLRKAGKTIFINSHLLSEVELICDRIVILKEGAALTEGTVESLTESHGEYNFEVRGSLGKIEENIQSLSLSYKRQGDSFLASLRQETDVDAIVDLLRGAGIGIRAITPVRETLEDMFLRILKQDQGGGGP